MPGATHLFFIPGVLLIGVFIGYLLGAKAVREEFERKRQAQKR